MNVGDYITGPYQGVSQAPPQVRLAQQAEALEDCYVGIPQGCIKRPPITLLGKLDGHPGDTNGVAEVFLAKDGNYHLLTVTVEGGVSVPRLYPLGDPAASIATTPIAISADAQAYLNTGVSSPVADLVPVTIEDNTFLLNRKKIVGKTGTAPTRPYECLIFVKLAAYAKTYSITVTPTGGDPYTASLHTPNGKDATDANGVTTDVIAAVLGHGGTYVTGNDASWNGNNLTDGLTPLGFTVTQIGPVIYISHPTLDFTVVTVDGQAGTAMAAIKNSVQTFGGLPERAVQGFVAKIAQQSSTADDDFYVQYNETAGGTEGVWQECIQPGAELGIDPLTMPVTLTPTNGWTLAAAPWKQRKVGNQMLLPDPDFVGQTLVDLSFWNGRLALLSSEAVTLSAADDPFQVYPSTLTTTKDSDPIALISPTPGKSTFKYSALFDQRLVAFGSLSQAALSSQGPPTLSTASLSNVADYEFAGGARPQASNGNLYFVASRGNTFSTVYELKSSRNSNGDYVLLGEDLTAAIPRYVPAGVDRVASSRVSYLLCYGVSGDTAIYPHLFRYAEGQRVQNAWERWNLTGMALGGLACQNTSIYLVLCYGGAAYLGMIDVAPEVLDPGSSRLLTHLDLRVTDALVTRTYDPAVDQTTVVLPYPIPDGRTMLASVRAPGGVGGDAVLVAEGGSLPEGFLATIVSVSGATAVLQGKYDTVPMWFGLQYSARYRLSTIYPLDRQGQPYRSNRTTLQRLLVEVAETGYLRAEVTPAGRPVGSVEYTGYTLDDPDSALDQAPYAETGTMSVPVMCDTTRVTVDLINDSIFQSKVLGFEWKGRLTQKTQRLG